MLWHIGNTTVRTPYRLREALRVLEGSPLNGNISGNAQENAFAELLHMNGVLDAPRVEEGRDASDLGRKWRAALSQLGFITPQLTNGNTGWPTPTVKSCAQDTLNPTPGQTGGLALPGAARLAGWYSPKASDHKGRGQTENWRGEDLPCQAKLAGWATPAEADKTGSHAICQALVAKQDKNRLRTYIRTPDDVPSEHVREAR